MTNKPLALHAVHTAYHDLRDWEAISDLTLAEAKRGDATFAWAIEIIHYRHAAARRNMRAAMAELVEAAKEDVPSGFKSSPIAFGTTASSPGVAIPEDRPIRSAEHNQAKEEKT